MTLESLRAELEETHRELACERSEPTGGADLGFILDSSGYVREQGAEVWVVGRWSGAPDQRVLLSHYVARTLVSARCHATYRAAMRASHDQRA